MNIVIHRMSKAFGFLWALKNIELEIGRGELVALLGPNGAGKSTLLNLVAGLLVPNSGSIELGGQRLVSGNSPLRRELGFLTPDAHFYEALTVFENLSLFVSFYKGVVDENQILGALGNVGLASRRDEYVSSLSHGMRCRLAIAKWTVIQPQLLLVDEPYGSLDGDGVNVLEAFLQGVSDRGGVVIIATHNVQRVLRLCSRAVILHQGSIIFDEPRQDPWNRFHEAFAEFVPRER